MNATAPEVTHRANPGPDRPRTRDAEFVDEAALASEDLVLTAEELALAAAEEPAPTADEQLALAVWHLRHVVALVPEGGRRGFLFQCWQHWTEDLTPDRRTALYDRTQAAGALVHDGPPAMGAAVEQRWDAHLRTLRRSVRTWTEQGAPVNYLLFHHAHLTHRRLGVPAVTEALAARAVRAALAPSGADLQPIAVPAAALQTA